jgi:hypothetical protein
MRRSCFASWISLTRTFVDRNTCQSRTFRVSDLVSADFAARPGRYEHDDDVIIMKSEHDEEVMMMNEAHRVASGGVQRAATRIVNMIDKPGHPDRSRS